MPVPYLGFIGRPAISEQSCVSPPLEEPQEHNIVGGSAGQKKKYTLLCTQSENQGIKQGK